MLDTSYSDAAIPVRKDLQQAHHRAFVRLAEAGTWWNGLERTAIAREVRSAPACTLCAKRKEALSPLAVEGEHDSEFAVPAAVVEVVHQVVNDPSRLSHVWFEKVMAAGLSKEHYVETIGVIVTVVSIDAFCRGIGVPPRPFREPEAGTPSRYRPPGAVEGEAWVPWVTERGARGAEQDLFDGMPKTGNVLKALSLVPDEVRQLKDLSAAHYLTPAEMMDLDRGRTLDRRQIELVAGRVSALAECFY